MPKVSVILPCYNVEKYLVKSINSILTQTFTNFELLVIIDGSPDNSKAIVSIFDDSRIKIFDKENGGLSDARNFGLERAKGEFIYFMDSDDWIEPNLIEDNIKILEEEKLNFVVFGYIQDNENLDGTVTTSHNIIPKLQVYEKGDKELMIDTYHLGILGYAWNKVYRKSFLDQHQFQFQKGISLVEDILFNAPIYKVSDKIRFNQKSYYHYINRDVETLMKQFHLNSFELKKMKVNVLNDFLNTWNINNKKEILAIAQIQGIRYCIHNLFSFKNQLNFLEKYKFISSMINDEQTKKLAPYYPTSTSIDRLYKLCIQNRLTIPIVIFALTK